MGLLLGAKHQREVDDFSLDFQVFNCHRIATYIQIYVSNSAHPSSCTVKLWHPREITCKTHFYYIRYYAELRRDTGIWDKSIVWLQSRWFRAVVIVLKWTWVPSAHPPVPLLSSGGPTSPMSTRVWKSWADILPAVTKCNVSNTLVSLFMYFHHILYSEVSISH